MTEWCNLFDENCACIWNKYYDVNFAVEDETNF